MLAIRLQQVKANKLDPITTSETTEAYTQHRNRLPSSPSTSSLFLGFLLIILTGCASTSPSCRSKLTLTWADTGQIREDIRVLTSKALQGRKTGTLGAKRTRDYLSKRFEAIGLTPWQGQFAHYFQYKKGFTNREGINLIAVTPAREPSSEWRILLAHYDHLGKKGSTYYPGADDNASGVAALLQIAQRAVVETPSVNLMFVAVDAEEIGLYGSQALVKQLEVKIGLSHISLALNLDMIGNPGRRRTIYLEGARNFPRFDEFKNQMKQNNLCIRKGHPKPVGTSIARTDWLRASDHYSFHKADVPWLYFGVPVHNQYHEPSDKLANLDLNFIAAVSETSSQLLQLNRHYFNN